MLSRIQPHLVLTLHLLFALFTPHAQFVQARVASTHRHPHPHHHHHPRPHALNSSLAHDTALHALLSIAFTSPLKARQFATPDQTGASTGSASSSSSSTSTGATGTTADGEWSPAPQCRLQCRALMHTINTCQGENCICQDPTLQSDFMSCATCDATLPPALGATSPATAYAAVQQQCTCTQSCAMAQHICDTQDQACVCQQSYLNTIYGCASCQQGTDATSMANSVAQINAVVAKCIAAGYSVQTYASSPSPTSVSNLTTTTPTSTPPAITPPPSSSTIVLGADITSGIEFLTAAPLPASHSGARTGGLRLRFAFGLPPIEIMIPFFVLLLFLALRC